MSIHLFGKQPCKKWDNVETDNRYSKTLSGAYCAIMTPLTVGYTLGVSYL